MEIKKKTVYRLKKKSIPSIHNNQIRKGQKIGGIKLIYSAITSIVKEYKWKNITIYVPTLTNNFREEKIFLRPFKKNWSERRNQTSRNDWGKKDHPLMNLWIELKHDYDDINKVTPRLQTEIRDHNFIKKLRNITDKFSIISNF